MSEIILKRIYSYLIDMIVVSVPMYIFIFIFWDKFIATNPRNLLSIALCIQFLPFILYFFLSELFFSCTVGKRIVKLKVITNSASNRFISILIRTVCRFIPFDLITFLFFKDRLLHDYLSNTKVVLDEG